MISADAHSNWIKVLRRELFERRVYDKAARPVAHHQAQTAIDMQFSFTRIVVDELEGTLTTNGWLGLVTWPPTLCRVASWRNQLNFFFRIKYSNFVDSLQRWTDEMMMWNPAAFGDLQSLKLHSDELWKPDIVVYNRWEVPQDVKTRRQIWIWTESGRVKTQRFSIESPYLTNKWTRSQI